MQDRHTDTTAEAPLIDIRRATVYRGSTRVFENFDLTIEQHRQVAILGPNGSGKSTLLKLVTRELYPVVRPGSSVRILGRETWNVWELRTHIGLVSHDLQHRYREGVRGLDVVVSGFLASIGVHGLLARQVTQEQLRRARAVMAELGVAEYAERPFGKLSTGQQRRCLLARALVHDPHTLVLDEPTAGLDLAASFDYLARLRALVRAGKNIVLVTHAVHEVPPSCDRVILLREGRIVADGSREAVLTRAHLAETFGVELEVERIGDWYHVSPPAAD